MTPEAFHLIRPEHLLVCTTRGYENFSSQHRNPGLEGLVWGWDPLLFWQTSTAEIALLIFNHCTWAWDQPIPHLCPSCHSPYGFFCISTIRFCSARFQVVLNDGCSVVCFNFDVIVGGCKYCIYLFCHLDQWRKTLLKEAIGSTKA